tara:strand:+ start:597 stop:701 length:105 start_codon:yes stop_codon:yes gene_type:complete
MKTGKIEPLTDIITAASKGIDFSAATGSSDNPKE